MAEIDSEVAASPEGEPHPGPPLTAEDLKTLELVEPYTQTGLELYRWWQETNRENSFADRFRLMRQYDPKNTNFGFIDETSLCGHPNFPVVGTAQQILYHRARKPEHTEVGWIKQQVREFMLKYFMRIASRSDPTLVQPRPEVEPPLLLRPLSWGAKTTEKRGWSYKQRYFKNAETGRVGLFPVTERSTIVDVRDVGGGEDWERKYDWVVMDVNIFDFRLGVPPFTDGPQLGLPFKSVANVVLCPEFIFDESDPDKIEPNPNNPRPEDRVVGRYGWGYVFIKPPERRGPLEYGPDGLGPAFMSFHFDVHESGDVRLYNYFAANQPNSLVYVPLNPLEWGFELANRATFGFSSRLLGPLRDAMRKLPFASAQLDPAFTFVELANLLSNDRAGRELLISRRQLLRLIMAIHFMDSWEFVCGTMGNWRRFPVWTDPDALPDWVKTGKSVEAP